MRALWNGHVLADGSETREVDGYTYFPRSAVRMDLLQPAEKTTSDRQCPHGVQFYDVADGKARAPRNAWSYEAATGSMQRVAQWIGFWDEVEVRP